MLIAIKKIAPALATGNSIVLKPSELAPVTPLEVLFCLDYFICLSLPEYLLNVVSLLESLMSSLDLVLPPDVLFAPIHSFAKLISLVGQQLGDVLERLLAPILREFSQSSVEKPQ
jgi:hypothetical protein